MKVKMWEEEVEALEKSHREERDNELRALRDSHSKEIKKWERAAEEALARLNIEKSAELKSLKDAVCVSSRLLVFSCSSLILPSSDPLHVCCVVNICLGQAEAC